MIYINKNSKPLLNILNFDIQLLNRTKHTQNYDDNRQKKEMPSWLRPWLVLTAKGDGHRGHRLS